jgi:ABC-2 type transport system permease protein
MSTATLSIAAARSNSFARTLHIYFTEARFEFVRLLRTRAFSLAVIGFPVIFYLFFGLTMTRGEHLSGVSVAKYMLGSYAVFGMVGAALFGIGGGLASELSTGWLELKRASPMPPLAYVVAKCCSAAAFGLIIVSLLTLLGITIGHVSITLPQFLRMMALTLIGTIPFACLGMVIALLVPFNAAPGVINIIYLPMSFCGGLWMPIMFLPHWLQKFALLLPTYHLSQLVLSCFGYSTAGSTVSHWLGLVGFTLVMLGVATIAYRRLEQNS